MGYRIGVDVGGTLTDFVYRAELGSDDNYAHHAALRGRAAQHTNRGPTQ
jgi:N-methylhydantoinase A/oxoprolinase/acetone carboxylase beta subunit